MESRDESDMGGKDRGERRLSELLGGKEQHQLVLRGKEGGEKGQALSKCGEYNIKKEIPEDERENGRKEVATSGDFTARNRSYGLSRGKGRTFTRSRKKRGAGGRIVELAVSEGGRVPNWGLEGEGRPYLEGR